MVTATSTVIASVAIAINIGLAAAIATFLHLAPWSLVDVVQAGRLLAVRLMKNALRIGYLDTGRLRGSLLLVLIEQIEARFHAYRHGDHRHGTEPESVPLLITLHHLFPALVLVELDEEVAGADARRVDVEGRLAVGEGLAAACAHPQLAHFRLVRKSVIADRLFAGPTMAIAARRYGTLRHPIVSDLELSIRIKSVV